MTTISSDSSDSSLIDEMVISGDINKHLVDKLVFDDPRIFDRLRINDPSLLPFVNDCVHALRCTAKETCESLKKIVEFSEGISKKKLEEEEAYFAVNHGPGTRSTREEQMYLHLETMFGFIENFQVGQVKRKYSRRLICSANTTTMKEYHTFDFPEADPDFVCCESSGHVRPEEHRWHNIMAFLKVKPSSNQGPKSCLNSDEPEVPPIVTKGASYARLHMSARPFQVFSVGFFIFGRKFCLAIFDRKGIAFSPIHDMWDDLGLFVQVVYRLSCDLSPVELGQDPTVKILESDDSRVVEAKCLIPLTRNTTDRESKEKSTLETASNFPTYIVSLGGTSSARWITIGPPIWNSLSFIGRGTSVWTVCELNVDGSLNRDKLFVMKNMWRSSGRSSESDIYSKIKPHPGIAVFALGSDVFFPEQGSPVISVETLRSMASFNSFQEEATPNSTSVLHRVFLKALGRSLIEYSTEAELLKAIRAAIVGHEHLCKSNILHSDISIGNILLAWEKNPAEGYEGFLADLECATDLIVNDYPRMNLPHEENIEPSVSECTAFSTVPALRGAMMTGTVQFMAASLLSAIQEQKTLERTASHDLESFVWVLTYVVHRRLMKEGKKEVYAEDFTYYFGQQSIRHVLGARIPMLVSPLIVDQAAPVHLFSPVMRELFSTLRGILSKAYNLIPTPITHKILIDALNVAIDEMQECSFVGRSSTNEPRVNI